MTKSDPQTRSATILPFRPPTACDPALLKVTKERPAGGPPLEIAWTHEPSPSLDPHGLRKDYDLWVAKRAMELLQSKYPGYPWSVRADSAKGSLTLSIPSLLGPCWCFHVAWPDLQPATIVRGGGELLERFRLPRSMIDLAAFLTATKDKAISKPRHKVPH